MAEQTPEKIRLLARTGTSPLLTFGKIASVLRAAGYDAQVADSLAGISSADFIITHNVNGFDTEELRNLLAHGTRVLTLVDTPLNKSKFLSTLPAGVIIACTDPCYIPLVNAITGGKNPVIDHPLEITLQEKAGGKPIAERRIDVLFVGRLVTFGALAEYSWLERKLATKIVNKGMHASDTPIHEVAASVFRPYQKLGLYSKPFTGDYFLNYCWKLTHGLRKKRRLFVLDELSAANAQLTLGFVSNDAPQLKKIMQVNVPGDVASMNHEFYDFMPWSDVIKLMHESKMVINTMPSHVDCLHEHLVEAMYSGAVCLTDENRKIRQTFTDEKDLLTFSYEPGSLAGKLLRFAGQDKMLQQIADSGVEKIAGLVNDHCWPELVEKIRHTA